MEAPPGFFYLKLPLMLRLEGVKGNAKVRLPERCRHIETSMLDGTILPAIQGIKVHPPQQVVEARVVT